MRPAPTTPERPSPGATAARGENPFAPRVHGRLVQVSPHVFCWRGIVNSQVFVGDRGIAVVDTQVNHGLARRLLADIATQFAKPVLYAINTHYHWDHTNGNPLFVAAGATVVANRATVQAMHHKQPRQKAFLAGRGFHLDADPPPATLLIEDCPTLDLGGITLELHRGHRAETDDPTLVWCPQDRVLAAGDTVMTGSFPIFGQPVQREGLYDDGWLEALAQVRSFGAQAVLAGHGPVAQAAELDTLERIIRYFLDATRACHARRCTLDHTIAEIEAGLPTWIRQIPEVWGTPRYAILRVWSGLTDLGEDGWQHVKPSAIPRADTAAATRASTLGDETFAWCEAVGAALEGGDPGLAVSLAEATTQRFAHSADAWCVLGNALIAASRGIASVLEKGDCFQAANAAWRQALERDSEHAPTQAALGQYHAMMAHRNGDVPTAAIAFCERALATGRLRRRAQAEATFYLGMAHRAGGDEAAARAQFAAALVIDPSFALPQMALAATQP